MIGVAQSTLGLKIASVANRFPCKLITFFVKTVGEESG
jgi:hypothetical protein